jgi:hypothetical protein
MKKSAIMIMELIQIFLNLKIIVAKVINSENEQIEEVSVGGTRAEKPRL